MTTTRRALRPWVIVGAFPPDCLGAVSLVEFQVWARNPHQARRVADGYLSRFAGLADAVVVSVNEATETGR